MTEYHVRSIEELFSIRLPSPYRKFLLDYPAALVRAKKDLGWKQESLSERELLDSAGRLADLNEGVRLPKTPWMRDGGPWPPQYFIVGDDECGNYWCIDLTQRNGGVWFYDHERGRFEFQYKSVRDFADYLLRDVEEWNREYGLPP